jgi:hypothetical protein
MGRPRRKAGETHREREMTEYRRNFVPGGSYFFTVNLSRAAKRRAQPG